MPKEMEMAGGRFEEENRETPTDLPDPMEIVAARRLILSCIGHGEEGCLIAVLIQILAVFG